MRVFIIFIGKLYHTTQHNIEDNKTKNYRPESYHGKNSIFFVLALPSLTPLFVLLMSQGLPPRIWIAGMNKSQIQGCMRIALGVKTILPVFEIFSNLPSKLQNFVEFVCIVFFFPLYCTACTSFYIVVLRKHYIKVLIFLVNAYNSFSIFGVRQIQ